MRSRPVYVYILAFSAFVLFGIGFIGSLQDRHPHDEMISLDSEHAATPQPHVVAQDSPKVSKPLTRIRELRQEFERARTEIERVQSGIESLRERKLELSFTSY